MILLIYVIIKCIQAFSPELAAILSEMISCSTCSKDNMEEILPGEGFSNNIYKEMCVKDLKNEYKRIKNDKYRFRAHVLKSRLEKDKVQYYIERLE